MAIDTRGIAPLLQVFDMATSLRFYCEVLGFEIVATDRKTVAPNHNWVWLRLNSSELMLNTAYESGERPPSPDPARIAAHNDTILYFGAPDVQAVYAHLLEKGMKIDPPKVAPYGMKQLYLHDPDGFALCFQWSAEKNLEHSSPCSTGM